MGIRDRPISPGSPWQNPYVERLIGTLRRECLAPVHLWRTAFATDPDVVFALLQGDAHAPRVGQGHAARTTRRAIWDHRHHYQCCPDCIIATRGYDFWE